MANQYLVQYFVVGGQEDGKLRQGSKSSFLLTTGFLTPIFKRGYGEGAVGDFAEGI